MPKSATFFLASQWSEVTGTVTNMYLAEAAEQIDTPYTSALIGMSLNGHADNTGNCQHGQITASKKLMIFWWRPM